MQCEWSLASNVGYDNKHTHKRSISSHAWTVFLRPAVSAELASRLESNKSASATVVLNQVEETSVYHKCI